MMFGNERTKQKTMSVWRIQPSGSNIDFDSINSGTSLPDRLELTAANVHCEGSTSVQFVNPVSVSGSAVFGNDLSIGSTLTVKSSTSRVGIGSTNPQQSLDIGSGNLNLTGTLVSGNLAGTLSTSSQTGITGLGSLSSLSVSGNVGIGTSNLVVNTTTDKIGIGTTDPQYDLHVVGDINLSGKIYRNGAEYSSFPWSMSSGEVYTTGDVGIGSSAPAKDLDVYGNINTQNLRYGIAGQGTVNMGTSRTISTSKSLNFTDTDSVDGPRTSLEWAAMCSGPGNDSIGGCATDSSGNVYVAGMFITSITAYSSQDVAFSSSVTSATGTRGLFVTKYNSSGEVQWIAKMTGVSTANNIRHLDIDSSGNVYIAVSVGGGNTLTIFNSDGTQFPTIVPNDGSDDGSIIKYDTNGFAQWFVRLSGQGAEFMFGVHIDSADNVYASGRFQLITVGNEFRIYNSDGTQFTPVNRTGATNLEGFIVKFNNAGFGQWYARVGGTTNDDWTIASSTDSSLNVYITGYFRSSTLSFFDAGSTTASFTLTNPSGTTQSAYTAKLNSSGAFQWVASIGGSGTDGAWMIKTTPSGDSYVVGYSSSATLNFRNASGTLFGSLTNDGATDGFLAKYNTSGAVQWVTKLTSTSDEEVNDIALDNSGNVIVSGQNTRQTMNIYNSDGSVFKTLTVVGMFGVKYDSNGYAIWAVNSDDADQQAASFRGVFTSWRNNEVVFTGFHNLTAVTFYDSDGQIGRRLATPLAENTTNTVFIAKYQENYIPFNLIDFPNVAANNGRVVRLVDTTAATSSATKAVLIRSVSGGPYQRKVSFTDDVSFVFYNGSWYQL
jgi:hypothetical protein